MEGYYRPWVATREHETGVKLRQMYAFDGITLTKCNRPVHAFVDITHVSPGTAPASPAAAVTTIRGSGPLGGLMVSGSGYGHGLGLSQWGAKQLAEDGWVCSDILLRFFSGTELVVWNGILPQPPGDLSDEFYRPFRTGEQAGE
jgi:SpoIID/LytB domain protein